MNTKSKRILALSTIVAFLGLLVSPANAEDPAPVVLTTSVATTGTIHVENVVFNDNHGSKVSSDFEFSIKHFGTNITGSPFFMPANGSATFVLEPGTYVVSATPVEDYLGTWTGAGIENGFIDLRAGQDVTIIRSSYDFGMVARTFPTTDPVTEPTTEDGGTLPATSTNWFNFLALGILLSAAGAYGFRKFELTK